MLHATAGATAVAAEVGKGGAPSAHLTLGRPRSLDACYAPMWTIIWRFPRW